MAEAARLDRIADSVIGAAIDVYRGLGPELLGSTCQACLARELMGRGVPIERQKPLQVRYREVELECGYRLDQVEGQVIVEVKSMESAIPIRRALLLS